jgi:hypothetical protein
VGSVPLVEWCYLFPKIRKNFVLTPLSVSLFLERVFRFGDRLGLDFDSDKTLWRPGILQ